VGGAGQRRPLFFFNEHSKCVTALLCIDFYYLAGSRTYETIWFDGQQPGTDLEIFSPNIFVKNSRFLLKILHWFLRITPIFGEKDKNRRKSPQIAENRPKSPKIVPNRQKSPKIAEKRQKL
jgi:hypothetical protein